MRLRELIEELQASAVDGPVDTEVSGIAYDSRRVCPGNVFVAIPGHRKDGHEFIEAAVQRGATAVICERPIICSRRATRIRVEDGREALARAASRYYAHPSRQLKVIGVTGTYGKTAVSFMIQSVLEAAGISTGLIGSVHYEIGPRRIPAQRTTPESLEVQQLMAQMVRAGCEACVLEVSSHGLDQKRVVGVEFDVGIFTNLGREHLEYHGSMEDYFAAKRHLFSALESEGKRGAMVVNIDDAFGARLAGQAQVEIELTYGLGHSARLRATDIQLGRRGCRFVVEGPEQPRFAVRLPLVGRPNIYNALAAIGTGLLMDVPAVMLQAALNALPPVPGCLERVEAGQPFLVLVDSAGTEGSLRQALSTVRELVQGRILLVFGCPGERETGRRARMGRVAAEGADVTLVTSDNPRRESAARIAEQIEQGYRAVRTNGCLIELDRAAAIGQVIDMAQPEDAVLIAGKGHQMFEEYEDTVIPFDDRFHAQAALELLGYGRAEPVEEAMWNLVR